MNNKGSSMNTTTLIVTSATSGFRSGDVIFVGGQRHLVTVVKGDTLTITPYTFRMEVQHLILRCLRACRAAWSWIWSK